jgi:hypothetical protein
MEVNFFKPSTRFRICRWLILVCIFLFQFSCKKDGDLKIISTEVIYSGTTINYFSFSSNVKMREYEWSIPSLDSIISVSETAEFRFEKSGLYLVELNTKSNLKKHTARTWVLVKGQPGSLYGWWGITGGHRYEVSLWVKGTKFDGTLHNDSVYFDVVAPSMFQGGPCISNEVNLLLPAGSYRYYIQYKTNPNSNFFYVDSSDCVIDGNCIKVLE